jgi:hypothetical protein
MSSSTDKGATMGDKGSTRAPNLSPAYPRRPNRTYYGRTAAEPRGVRRRGRRPLSIEGHDARGRTGRKTNGQADRRWSGRQVWEETAWAASPPPDASARIGYRPTLYPPIGTRKGVKIVHPILWPRQGHAPTPARPFGRRGA